MSLVNHKARATHFALLAVLTLTGGAVFAQAQPEENIVVKGKPLPSGVETRIVKISDLNLTLPEGEKEMNRRVGRAVESICNKADTADLSGQKLDQKCRDNAWAGARPQMDRALEYARAR